MKIKLQEVSDVKPATDAHYGDSGMNVYSVDDYILLPGERGIVSTNAM